MFYEQSYSLELYSQAINYLGLEEVPGKQKTNPILRKWILAALPWLDSNIDDGEIAWCGIFAARVLKDSGLQMHIPKQFYRARNWLEVGISIPIDQACAGDIAVYWRKSPNSGLKHVAFISDEMQFISEKEYYPKVLGGNQKNRVGIDYYNYERLEDVRRIPKAFNEIMNMRDKEFNYLENMLLKIAA